MISELLVSAFVTLFVVIDPPGIASIYAGLTSGAPAKQTRTMALKASLIATIILLVFAFFGKQLLGALGIALDSFRIAGGLMLFFIAFEMVFERRTKRRNERADKMSAAQVEDVSIFPVAIPMLAGPGAIAAIMLLMNEASGFEQTAQVLAALAAVMALTLFALLAAGPLMRCVGDNAQNVVTRLLGVLLAALATQYIMDGVKGSFGLLVEPQALAAASAALAFLAHTA